MKISNMSDEYFINNILPLLKDDKGNLISAKVNKHNVYINNLELYNYLDTRYNSYDSFGEVIYRIEHNIDELPTCPVCGKVLQFIRYCKGYQQFCSNECKYSDIGHKIMNTKIILQNQEKYGCDWYLSTNEYKEKAKHTYIEKYGVDHSSKADIVKQHNKNTCLSKYGVEYSFQSDNNKEKSKNTLLEHYGVDHTMKSDIIKEKFNNTIKNKYGVSRFIDSSIFHEKSLISKRESQKIKWLKYGYDIEYCGKNELIVKNCCDIHKDVKMTIGTFFNRKNQNKCMCTICNPLEKGPISSEEIELTKFLDKNNILYKLHDRTIIKPLELDIYIPEFNLAIECNGVYWHSEVVGVVKDYHQYKSKLCENQGIQLIHIWEDDWQNNKEKILDILKIKLHLSNIQRIYARKCIVKEIDSKVSRDFINANHLQGNINASIKLGLFYNDLLVSVMTFGQLRKSLGSKAKKDIYELYRFCSLQGYSIIGGASKLLNYFKKHYEWKEIISYAKYDISNGNVYEKIGFAYSGLTAPNYYWVNRHNGIKRENRFNYRKSEIIKMFNEDPHCSEVEIMYKHGFYRCYDSGNKKYIMINENNKENL
jgi:endogenous inhibitor of DNA gyrase (YacG/DUF329 family)